MRASLGNKTFQLLISTWFIAHLCMWMNDVTAAWIMTTLTQDPLQIALVQTAATLPIFILGLPAGALADMLDRRRIFIFTQFWSAGVALLFGLLAFTGNLTPIPLLLLMLANGAGLALRWPVFAALLPTAVPRAQLRSALALTAVAGNSARVIGPLFAGLVIASLGPPWVFAVNTVLCVVTGIMMLRWKPPPDQQPRSQERLLPAMLGGLRFIRHSKPMHSVLISTVAYFPQAAMVIALMPLIAHGMPNAGPGTYSALLAAMGLSAIGVALSISRIVQWLGPKTTLTCGRLGHVLAAAMLAVAPNLWVALPAMFIFGFAWIATGNTLTTSAQTCLPDHVRARGMSVYQMVIMGSSAGGAAFWGHIASLTSLRTGLLLAALTSLVLFIFTRQFNMPVEKADDAH